MRINLERLLAINLGGAAGHTPGKQTWIGEHVERFLHAAAYLGLYRNRGQLKARMDSGH